MRESDIEKYLVKRVKALGGEVRKVMWIGRQGAPDRLVMLPERCFTERVSGTMSLETEVPANAFWVEVKPLGGKAKFPSNAHERKQHREHERMRKMGQRVEVIDSYEGVDELLGVEK